MSIEVRDNDVLSGRGKCWNMHHGNQNFRRIVETFVDAYTKGTKKQKVAISKSIVEKIHSMKPPGRFLKKSDTGQWTELSSKDATDKVAQAIAYAVRTNDSRRKYKRSNEEISLPGLACTNARPISQPHRGMIQNYEFAPFLSTAITPAQHNVPLGMGPGLTVLDSHRVGFEANQSTYPWAWVRNNPRVNLLQQTLSLQQQPNQITTLPANSLDPTVNRLAQMEMVNRAHQTQQQQQFQQQLRHDMIMSQQFPASALYLGFRTPSLQSPQPLSTTFVQGLPRVTQNAFLGQNYPLEGYHGFEYAARNMHPLYRSHNEMVGHQHNVRTNGHPQLQQDDRFSQNTLALPQHEMLPRSSIANDRLIFSSHREPSPSNPGQKQKSEGKTAATTSSARNKRRRTHSEDDGKEDEDSRGETKIS